MISNLLGNRNTIGTETGEEYGSFRPAFRHFYNGSFANPYIRILTRDGNGDPVIRYYDLCREEYIDDTAE